VIKDILAEIMPTMAVEEVEVPVELVLLDYLVTVEEDLVA